MSEFCQVIQTSEYFSFLSKIRKLLFLFLLTLWWFVALSWFCTNYRIICSDSFGFICAEFEASVCRIPATFLVSVTPITLCLSNTSKYKLKTLKSAKHRSYWTDSHAAVITHIHDEQAAADSNVPWNCLWSAWCVSPACFFSYKLHLNQSVHSVIKAKRE